MTTAHEHVCHLCGHTWWCEPASYYAPCANAVRNGNPRRLCDLCWGMRKPAREPRPAGHDETGQ